MTDKQIIVDGVDVSGCINRNDLKFASYNCYLNGGCQCKDNPNCYYKQFKRKEQECNKYKQTLTEIEEIAMGIMDDDLEESSAYYDAKQILQKISKCEVER